MGSQAFFRGEYCGGTAHVEKCKEKASEKKAADKALAGTVCSGNLESGYGILPADE